MKNVELVQVAIMNMIYTREEMIDSTANREKIGMSIYLIMVIRVDIILEMMSEWNSVPNAMNLDPTILVKKDIAHIKATKMNIVSELMKEVGTVRDEMFQRNIVKLDTPALEPQYVIFKEDTEAAHQS